MTASMKMIGFWDTVPYSLIEVDLRFIGTYFLNYQSESDYGGSKILRNVSQLLRNYTEQFPTKLLSS
jgi:hypothetical protein